MCGREAPPPSDGCHVGPFLPSGGPVPPSLGAVFFLRGVLAGRRLVTPQRPQKARRPWCAEGFERAAFRAKRPAPRPGGPRVRCIRRLIRHTASARMQQAVGRAATRRRRPLPAQERGGPPVWRPAPWRHCGTPRRPQPWPVSLGPGPPCRRRPGRAGRTGAGARRRAPARSSPRPRRHPRRIRGRVPRSRGVRRIRRHGRAPGRGVVQAKATNRASAP